MSAKCNFIDNNFADATTIAVLNHSREKANLDSDDRKRELKFEVIDNLLEENKQILPDNVDNIQWNDITNCTYETLDENYYPVEVNYNRQKLAEIAGYKPFPYYGGEDAPELFGQDLIPISWDVYFHPTIFLVFLYLFVLILFAIIIYRQVIYRNKIESLQY